MRFNKLQHKDFFVFDKESQKACHKSADIHLVIKCAVDRITAINLKTLINLDVSPQGMLGKDSYVHLLKLTHPLVFSRDTPILHKKLRELSRGNFFTYRSDLSRNIKMVIDTNSVTVTTLNLLDMRVRNEDVDSKEVSRLVYPAKLTHPLTFKLKENNE